MVWMYMIIISLVIDALFLLLLIQLQTSVRDIFTRYITQVWITSSFHLDYQSEIRSWDQCDRAYPNGPSSCCILSVRTGISPYSQNQPNYSRDFFLLQNISFTTAFSDMVGFESPSVPSGCPEPSYATEILFHRPANPDSTRKQASTYWRRGIEWRIDSWIKTDAECVREVQQRWNETVSGVNSRTRGL